MSVKFVFSSFPIYAISSEEKNSTLSGFVLSFSFVLKQVLALYSRVASNQKYSCFTHLNVVIKGTLHYIQYFQNFITPLYLTQEKVIEKFSIHLRIKSLSIICIIYLKHFKLPTKIFIVFIWKITLVRETECSFSFFKIIAFAHS